MVTTIHSARTAQRVYRHSHTSSCLHMHRHIVLCRVQGCWYQSKHRDVGTSQSTVVAQQSMHTQSSAIPGDRQPQTDSKENLETNSHQSDRSSQQTKPVWVQKLQTKWDSLDTAQKAYAVGVCVLALAAAPKLLTLLVIGLERVFIGGLLAIEEALLGVLFKGGAVLGLVGVLGVLLFGIYLFMAPKTTK